MKKIFSRSGREIEKLSFRRGVERDLRGRRTAPASRQARFRSFLLRGFIVLLSVASGCGGDKSFVEERTLTETQKEFIEIRSLHERQKSELLIRRGKRFLEQVQEEELRRPVQYYMAVNSEKLGRIQQAKKYYAKLFVYADPMSPWVDLARESLRSLEARQLDRSEIS